MKKNVLIIGGDCSLDNLDNLANVVAKAVANAKAVVVANAAMEQGLPIIEIFEYKMPPRIPDIELYRDDRKEKRNGFRPPFYKCRKRY